MLLISNPITIVEVKTRTGLAGYKVEPWLKTTKDDMFILKLDDILTMSESSDIEMILMYQSYVRDEHSDKTGQPKLSKKMGFISTVNDAKEILEKIYKSS